MNTLILQLRTYIAKEKSKIKLNNIKKQEKNKQNNENENLKKKHTERRTLASKGNRKQSKTTKMKSKIKKI